jgi:hypothetical protein
MACHLLRVRACDLFLRSFLFVAHFSLAASAFAQVQHNHSTIWIVDGLQQPQLQANILRVDQASKPKLKQAGYVVIDSDAAQVSVRAEDKERNRIPVVKWDAGKFVILGTGKLWVRVTCIDFDAKLYQEDEFTISVGDPDPDPDKPDEPEPEPKPIPADDFGIARRVWSVVKELSGRDKVSAAYLAGSKSLREDPTVTQTQVGEQLIESLAAIPEYKQFGEFAELLNKDVQARWPLSRGVHADYLEAIALGLKGTDK